MDIILEKITTKPPIRKIVAILLLMLSANTSPKFENETKFFTGLGAYICSSLIIFPKSKNKSNSHTSQNMRNK